MSQIDDISLGQHHPQDKHTNQNDKLEPKIFVVAHHHLIMSFHSWSSVLERQQGVSSAICASELLDELVSKRSDNKDSSLDEEYRSNNSTSSSSNSTLMSISDSSGSRSEM